MHTRSIPAAAAALAIAWGLAVHCGDGGIGLTSDCNPACPIGWSCIDGACVEGADVADAPDAETVRPDVPPDLPPDLVPDVPPDLPPDLVPDVPPDTPPDLVPDVPPDTRPDRVPDESPDTPPDLVPDVPPDTLDGETTPVRNTGSRCDSDLDCVGPDATCLTRVWISWIGELVFNNGYCSSSCGGGADCGPDGYCADARAVGGPVQCMRSCTSDAECRSSEGYSCTNFMIFPETFCAPL